MGNFLADFYSVNGLVLESRKRREHLSEEDILRNKAIMESLSKGGNLIEQNYEVSSAVEVLWLQRMGIWPQCIQAPNSYPYFHIQNVLLGPTGMMSPVAGVSWLLCVK